MIPFNALDHNPTSYEFLGHKLLVFHSTSSSNYSLAQRKQLGIGACNLPFGVLLVSFAHPALPQVIVSEVEKLCAKLRLGPAAS